MARSKGPDPCQLPLIERCWVAGCDPGVDWAMFAKHLTDGNAPTLFNGSELIGKATTPARTCDALDGMAATFFISGITPCDVVIALEGAWLSPGCNKKQTLAYAKRVGWFEMKFSQFGFNVAIVPPAFGKGGGSWKVEQGVARRDGTQRMKVATERSGIEMATEHMADAWLLCDWLQRRVHKHLMIGVEVPKCLMNAIKHLKKGGSE